MEITNIKSILKLLRVREWWYISGIALLGLVNGLKDANGSVNLKLFGIVFITACLYLAFGYFLNSIFDKIYFLTKDTTKKPLIIGLLILATNVSITFFTYRILTPIVIGGGILSITYSYRPLKIKNNIYLNFFLNSLGFSLIYLIGYLPQNKRIFQNTGAIRMFIIIFILFIIFQIIHHIEHCKIDRQTKGTANIYNLLGKRKTFLLIYIFLFLLFVFTFTAEAGYFNETLFKFITGLYILISSIITKLYLNKNISKKLFRKNFKMTGALYGITLVLCSYLSL